MNKLKHTFIALLLAVNVFGQTALDTYINGKMNQYHIPGLSVCVIKNGKLAWLRAYGYANLEQSKPVTRETAFMLASISKTFIATALMQVYENGGFLLDDPVNNYLPFSVINPNCPGDSITFRELLAHTSGISDNWDIINTFYVNGDSPVLLHDCMENYLVPGGIYYDSSLNFSDHQPGTYYEYCNMAASLAALLVEEITGIPFDKYCEDSIFKPLCMNNTGWLLADFPDTNVIARPYTWYNGNYTDDGLYGYPDYPDGQLRTTAVALGKFMLMNMQYGLFGNKRILDSLTVNEMRSIQFPLVESTQGLIWYTSVYNNDTVWGHNGGDMGVSTDMYFDEQKQTGVIALSNSEAYLTPIINKLFASADTMNIANAPKLECNTDSVGLYIMNYTGEGFEIYPNPAHDKVWFQIPKYIGSTMEIKLYDLNFRELDADTRSIGNKYEVDISGLGCGLYILEIITQDAIFREKFIRN